MSIQDRISNLQQQLKDWQERRQVAADALNQAQAAILQLQGAIAFAESLITPEGSPNDDDAPMNAHAAD